MFLKHFAFLKGVEVILDLVIFLTELASPLMCAAVRGLLANRDGSSRNLFLIYLSSSLSANLSSALTACAFKCHFETLEMQLPLRRKHP